MALGCWDGEGLFLTFAVGSALLLHALFLAAGLMLLVTAEAQNAPRCLRRGRCPINRCDINGFRFPSATLGSCPSTEPSLEAAGQEFRARWSQAWAVGIKPWARATYWGHGGAAGAPSFRNLDGHLFGSKPQVLVLQLGQSVLHRPPSSRGALCRNAARAWDPSRRRR